jgi:hypothetical protein
MIGGTYFITTGTWDNNVALAGLPYALGATGVIFGKHVDKYAEDKVKKIHTLPVIIGERAARSLMAVILVAQYVVVAYLVAIGFFTPVLLIVFLALPKLVPTLRTLRSPPARVAAGRLPAERLAWLVRRLRVRAQPALGLALPARPRRRAHRSRRHSLADRALIQEPTAPSFALRRGIGAPRAGFLLTCRASTTG